jgi:energy-converting hydrogenase Eha subunit A
MTAVVVTLSSCGVLVALTQTLAVPLVPSLPRLLGTDPGTAGWEVTATLVAGCIARPVLGRLGDMYGKRRTLLAALAAVVAGSVLCGATSSMGPLIDDRALAGVGGDRQHLLSSPLIVTANWRINVSRIGTRRRCPLEGLGLVARCARVVRPPRRWLRHKGQPSATRHNAASVRRRCARRRVMSVPDAGGSRSATPTSRRSASRRAGGCRQPGMRSRIVLGLPSWWPTE